MSFFVYPYKTGSASAKAIATKLGITLLRREGSKFVGSSSKTVVNWGAQELSNAANQCRIVNLPHRLRDSSNKRTFFHSLASWNANYPPESRVPSPLAFFNYQDAYQYFVSNPGTVIMARTILNGHSGAGIVVLKNQQDWDQFQGTPCNLFTLYIKKLGEYRLHFTDFSTFDSEAFSPHVFFAQRKALRSDLLNNSEIANIALTHQVRNLANGYVYVNEAGALEVPDVVHNVAQKFLKFNQNTSKLHFGALDIIYVKKYNKAYVLEVNAAPGLSGLTIEKYADEFTNLKNYLEA